MKDEEAFRNMDNINIDNTPFYKRRIFLISAAAGGIIIIAIIIIVAASSGDGKDSNDDGSDGGDAGDGSCIIGKGSKCLKCAKKSKKCAACNPGYTLNDNYNRGEECDIDYSIKAIYKTEKDNEEINLLDSNYKSIITELIVDEKKKIFLLNINFLKQVIILFYLKLISKNTQKYQVCFQIIKILYL